MTPVDVKAAIAGDIRAMRRVARLKQGPVATMLADIAVRTCSRHVANQAAASLSRRDKDRAAIAAMANVLRATPADDETGGFEWCASALAKRKEPAALRAAIASYRAMPPGRARYFLVLGLSNRTERDKSLRKNAAFVQMMMDVVKDSNEEDARGAAIWALWRLAHPRSMPLMLELLETDADPYVRTTAARALAAIGGKRAVAALRPFLATCTDDDLVAELTPRLRSKG